MHARSDRLDKSTLLCNGRLSRTALMKELRAEFETGSARKGK